LVVVVAKNKKQRDYFQKKKQEKTIISNQIPEQTPHVARKKILTVI
jgi:hypothetical protein